MREEEMHGEGVLVVSTIWQCWHSFVPTSWDVWGEKGKCLDTKIFEQHGELPW